MGIFVGAKEKFKSSDSRECSSEDSEYDKLTTTALLGFSAEFVPGLGRRDSNLLTGLRKWNSIYTGSKYLREGVVWEDL